MIKEGMLYFKKLGLQINFIVSLGIVSTICYFISDVLPINELLKSVFKGIFLFEAAFFLIYSFVLVKKHTEKVYR